MLVGNKTDLQIERKVPKETGQELAQSWNAMFLETSAKHNLVSTLIMHDNADAN